MASYAPLFAAFLCAGVFCITFVGEASIFPHTRSADNSLYEVIHQQRTYSHDSKNVPCNKCSQKCIYFSLQRMLFFLLGGFLFIYLNEYGSLVTAFVLQAPPAEQVKWIQSIEKAKVRVLFSFHS